MRATSAEARLALQERDSDAARGADLADRLHALRDVDEICDFIEADVRERIAQGLAVTLQRYMTALGDRAEEPAILDTVIDLAHQSLMAAGLGREEAVERLVSERPDLESQIRESLLLGDALAMSALETTWGSNRAPEARRGPKPRAVGGRDFSVGARYELGERLGAGAFGAVYRAIDRALTAEGQGVEVAVKILDTPGGASLHEAARARRVRHASVVRVYDHGATEDGRGFIVYELVEGPSLREVVSRSGPMRARDAARLVAQIADGVHAAHAVQVLHRDLNPGNVLLDASGAARVTDFGVSAGIGERPAPQVKSQPLGAPGFVAPEQWHGYGQESVQTDVYGLGGLLFYLLTGECPNGASFDEVRRYLEDPFDRSRQVKALAKLPRDLRLITLRALSPGPQERHDAASHVAEDLRLWLLRRPVPSTNPGVLRTAALLVRRRPIGTSVAAVAVLVMAMSLALAGHGYGRLRQFEQWRIEFGQRMIEAQKSLSREGQLAAMPLTYSAFSTMNPSSFLRLFADPQVSVEARRAALDRLASEGLANYGPDDPRTLMWRTAAGLVRLTNGNEVGEDTREFLIALRDEWGRRLPAGSVWVQEMDAWVKCARIKELFFRDKNMAPLTSEEIAELEALAQELDAMLPMFDGWMDQSPTHDIVLRALIGASQSHMLNRPEEIVRYKAMRSQQ